MTSAQRILANDRDRGPGQIAPLETSLPPVLPRSKSRPVLVTSHNFNTTTSVPRRRIPLNSPSGTVYAIIENGLGLSTRFLNKADGLISPQSFLRSRPSLKRFFMLASRSQIGLPWFCSRHATTPCSGLLSISMIYGPGSKVSF